MTNLARGILSPPQPNPEPSVAEVVLALHRLATIGVRWHGGIPRFGFASVAGWLVPDDAEQAVVEKARDLRGQGLSLRAIGERLADAGYRPRQGETWHATQIARLLT